MVECLKEKLKEEQTRREKVKKKTKRKTPEDTEYGTHEKRHESASVLSLIKPQCRSSKGKAKKKRSFASFRTSKRNNVESPERRNQ